MAEISFEITSLNGSRIVPQELVSYEWTRDADAACDGLRLCFLYDGVPFEAVKIKAYFEDAPVFFGYADYQCEENGIIFIYARSSACLLVDNEAGQATLNSPSAAVLFNLNAKPFGFKNRLENRFVKTAYTVGKGTSCYGAINNFMRAFFEKNIVVSPENELYIPSGDIAFNLDSSRVISVNKTINRGNAVSRIDYKTGGEYNRHRASKTLEKSDIRRTRRLNTANVPAFERDIAISKIIRDAARDYYGAAVVLEGAAAPELYSPVVFEGLEGYVVTSFKVVCNKNGEKTKLVLCRPIDLKETDYVA